MWRFMEQEFGVAVLAISFVLSSLLSFGQKMARRDPPLASSYFSTNPGVYSGSLGPSGLTPGSGASQSRFLARQMTVGYDRFEEHGGIGCNLPFLPATSFKSAKLQSLLMSRMVMILWAGSHSFRGTYSSLSETAGEATFAHRRHQVKRAESPGMETVPF